MKNPKKELERFLSKEFKEVEIRVLGENFSVIFCKEVYHLKFLILDEAPKNLKEKKTIEVFYLKQEIRKKINEWREKNENHKK